MRLFNDKKKLITMFLIPLIYSVYAIFFMPQLFKVFTGQTTIYTVALAVGTVLCALALLFLTAFLFYIKSNKNKSKTTFGYAFTRVICTVLILLSSMVILSMLYGLVAVFINQMLKDNLKLDQIKGIINFMISIATILVLPLFISIFWEEANCKDTFFKSLVNGIAIKGKVYLRLLILIVISFAIGLIAMTAFNYLSDGIVLNIFKTILMTILGTIGLNISENIIK